MDLKKYIYSHCISPKLVKVWDCYSQQSVFRFMPCGSCLHCKNTYINEWVTRLLCQKLYSKYCYYVSLDYSPFDESNPVALQLASETAACYNDLNYNRKYGLQPLILCKNHLQDFYKRLRRNTGIKLQYFACGEYGMHANGCGYGRPHFHNIIFTDSLLTEQDFISAWTLNGYKIGRVDFQDMSAFEVSDSSAIKCFKYVCKYLQKADFDFEKLATIDFHRAYFKSLQFTLELAKDLFSEDRKIPIEDRSILDINWKQYIKQYSPFIVCSRRPSIGSDYFEKNLDRFKTKDFRLFGLQGESLAFPRYFLRRTKEAVFNFSCIGEKSQVPSSSARMGYVLQILRSLYADYFSIENWSENADNYWCVRKNQLGVLCLNCNSGEIPLSSLNFYDRVNKFLYQFDGYHYNVWAKLKTGSYSLINVLDIIDVINEVEPTWNYFYSTFVKPFHDSRVLNERDLNNSIECFYNDLPDGTSKFQQFKNEVYARYRVELDTIRKHKLLMSNSKLTL